MKTKNLLITGFSLLVLFSTNPAHSLTMEQFSDICAQHSGDCHDLPLINAYIGGAMDLIATLDERTDYLPTKIYCADPREIFNAEDIVAFMLRNDQNLSSENAMISFIQYFEVNGGCADE